MKPFESFKFNKSFGQNFISDKNLLNAIAVDSGISFNDNVLEIGTGAGTLTMALSAHAKKVVSYEIDKKLTEFLQQKFANVKNVEVVFADALKTPIQEICARFGGQDFHIVANLPYYITTPLIFKFLEQTTLAKTITVMVQKEVAEKIISQPGEANYGIISAILQYYYSCRITRTVNKKMFFPVPKVDSAVIHLCRKEVPFDAEFSAFVRGIFAMKRKTIQNNLSKCGFAKEKTLLALKQMGLPETARAEILSFDKLRTLFDKLR